MEKGPAARHVVVAVDSSDASKMAVLWAARNVLKSNENMHLVKAVRVRATRTAVRGSFAGVEPEAAAAELQEAAEFAAQAGLGSNRVHTSLLPLSEAAPSPGAAIVTFATAGRFKLVVLGSRGMGAFKRALMSLMGTGSVSSYVVDHARTPVAVVRQDVPLETALHAPSKRTICVAVDGSPSAEAALNWALANMVDPAHDVLHLVSVIVTPPFPASDDVGPTGAIIDSYMEEKDRAVADASRAVRAAAAVALEHGMPQEHIVQAAIEPVTDVTSVISAAIAHYVSTNQVDDLVVASRGMSAFKAAMLTLVGLGSVSRACVQRAPCPVIVVRLPDAAGK